jgi:hypothetical protein
LNQQGQSEPSPPDAGPIVIIDGAMSSDEPNSSSEPGEPAPPRGRPWSRPDVWVLGLSGAIGLLGFIATFALILMRSPATPVQRALTTAEVKSLTGPPGERGPPGPPGARGAAGDPGLRIVRNECTNGNCTVECADDEALLNAYCNPNRTPAAYPSEHSALCRTQGRGRIEAVAACAKARR